MPSPLGVSGLSANAFERYLLKRVLSYGPLLHTVPVEFSLLAFLNATWRWLELKAAPCALRKARTHKAFKPTAHITLTRWGAGSAAVIFD
jgi:hypothetical protein